MNPAPTREELIRDGIPPALIEFHVARAKALRALALAAFAADLKRWLESRRPGGARLPRDTAF